MRVWHSVPPLAVMLYYLALPYVCVLGVFGFSKHLYAWRGGAHPRHLLQYSTVCLVLSSQKRVASFRFRILACDN